MRRGLLTPFQANEIHQGRAARLVLGQYLLLDRLGAGGMGEVFQARHRVLDRPVALKVIRPEFVNHPDAVERFRRECRAAGLLSHPNIVTVHDAHQAGDVHFLAMELLDGKDLGRLLKERALLPPGEACECARQAALGLQHAHEKGMVHRDVKPANLMLTAGGVVKLLDLGLARLREGTAAGRPDSDLTRAGSIMGTPDYISPEQAAGETAAADGRADVYSLGCTLFHLLTGRPPFTGKSAREIISAHLTQPPPRADEVRPGLHPGLGAVVRRMMEKDPGARYPSAGEVAAALQPFCSGADAPAAPATSPNPIAATVTYTPAPTGGPKSPGRWIAVAAALLLACGAIGAFAWWKFSPPPRVGAPIAALPADKDQDPAPPGPGPAPGPVVPPVIKLPPPPKHPVRDGLDWPPADCVALLGDDSGRHWGQVQAVAFRPDGKVIATADRVGDRAFIHLWDATSQKERAAWTPAGLGVMDLAYSPDGRRLAAVCGDGLRLWDAADDGLGNERKFGEPGSRPGSNLFHLLFTADGKSLLAWDSTGAVRRWRLTKAGVEGDGDPNPAPPHFYALAISADGRTLAYSRQDKATGKQLVCVTTMYDKQAAEMTAEISSGADALALSADGKRLAARVLGGAGELRVWDVDGGNLRPRKTVDLSKLGLSNFVAALRFTPDGSAVVDVSAPRGGPSAVWLFDANTGEAKQLEGVADQATCLSMPAAGRSIAVGGSDRLLHVRDLEHGLEARPSPLGPAGPVQRLAFRRGGTELALVSRRDERPEGNGEPSSLIVWDLATLQSHVMTPPGGWFTDCAYTPDGVRLFAAGTAPAMGGAASLPRRLRADLPPSEWLPSAGDAAGVAADAEGNFDRGAGLRPRRQNAGPSRRRRFPPPRRRPRRPAVPPARRAVRGGPADRVAGPDAGRDDGRHDRPKGPGADDAHCEVLGSQKH